MPRTLDVLISGAGIAGPTLAYWLARHGHRPTLVERAPAPRGGGYMIDFWGPGYDVAERMGLLPTLQREGYRMDEVRIVDRHGARVAGFSASTFAAAVGDRFLTLRRGDLASRILELAAPASEIIYGDSIATLRQVDETVDVTFQRAPARAFDVVIGADGLHSNVRSLAFGDGARFEQYLGYCTAAFSAQGYPHRDENVYASYSVPGGQVARYALRDDFSVFFFIFARPEPPDIPPHDVAAQKRLLQEMFAGAGWESDAILGALGRATDLYFDTVSQVRMPSWHRDRVGLVGDAAACPSLLSGQGSSLGMAGAWVLAREIARSPDDPIAALEAYDRTLRTFVERTQRSAARFARWFAPRTRVGIGIRNFVTNLINLPLVGPAIARRSFGNSIQLPD